MLGSGTGGSLLRLEASGWSCDGKPDAVPDARARRTACARSLARGKDRIVSKATSFLPFTDGALLAWSLNFSTRISEDPTRYGLLESDAVSYASLHAAYGTGLAACDPGVRNRAAVAAKNAARSDLKHAARRLALRVQGGSASDAQKLELGLTVRRPKSSIPPPSDAPALDVMFVMGRSVHFRLRDMVVSGRRARPDGTAGAALFRHVGPTAPREASDWIFVGNTGRTKDVVEFDATLPPGTIVWITASWFNPRGQRGPCSAARSAMLTDGVVSLAA